MKTRSAVMSEDCAGPEKGSLGPQTRFLMSEGHGSQGNGDTDLMLEPGKQHQTAQRFYQPKGSTSLDPAWTLCSQKEGFPVESALQTGHVPLPHSLTAIWLSGRRTHIWYSAWLDKSLHHPGQDKSLLWPLLSIPALSLNATMIQLQSPKPCINRITIHTLWVWLISLYVMSQLLFDIICVIFLSLPLHLQSKHSAWHLVGS